MEDPASVVVLHLLARHEHALDRSMVDISHTVLHVARSFGFELPDEGAWLRPILIALRTVAPMARGTAEKF